MSATQIFLALLGLSLSAHAITLSQISNFDPNTASPAVLEFLESIGLWPPASPLPPTEPTPEPEPTQPGTPKKWNDLIVTWAESRIFNQNAFRQLPRTVADASMKGYQQNTACNANGNFQGRQWVHVTGDPAIKLLFDVNGFIAGMQTSVPLSVSNYPSDKQTPPFVKDGNYWIVTVYFVDPSIICNGGRSQADFDADGTGTGLYIQTGNTSADYMKVPMNESGLAGTQWVKGYCKPGMGQHYWYDWRTDSSCDELLPVFLLYNKGNLNAFGWYLLADLHSNRYEKLPEHVNRLHMKDVPTCLSTVGQVSSMRVYLTDRPREKNNC